MLVEAAAATWGVPASECYAADSAVVLKDPTDFKLLGTRISGVDNPAALSCCRGRTEAGSAIGHD
jgi:hypothetical protein